MAERIPITKEGMLRIKEELHHLLTVERPSIQKAIAEAREHGDLRENAEYHAAKEKQSFIEGRIGEINGRMALMEVVSPGPNSRGSVTFGAKVTIEDVESGEVQHYQIVGPDESDTRINRLSFLSPVAKALIGKQEGDVVKIHIPRGNFEVEITSITYEEEGGGNQEKPV